MADFSFRVCKCGNRKVNDSFRIDLAISVCRAECESKLVACVEACNSLFEFREQVTHSLYKAQRPLNRAFVRNFPVNNQFIGESHHSILINLHILFIIKGLSYFSRASFICRKPLRTQCLATARLRIPEHHPPQPSASPTTRAYFPLSASPGTDSRFSRRGTQILTLRMKNLR